MCIRDRGELTEANIGEKVYKGTSMIPAVLRDSSNLEDNIMPAVQKGWQLMGLIEGVHLSLIHI